MPVWVSEFWLYQDAVFMALLGHTNTYVDWKCLKHSILM